MNVRHIDTYTVLPRTVKSSGVLSLWKCKTSEHYASEKKGEGVGEKIWHKTWFSILWSLALGVLWSTGAQEKLQKKLSGIDLHLKTFFVHTSIPIARGLVYYWYYTCYNSETQTGLCMWHEDKLTPSCESVFVRFCFSVAHIMNKLMMPPNSSNRQVVQLFWRNVVMSKLPVNVGIYFLPFAKTFFLPRVLFVSWEGRYVVPAMTLWIIKQYESMFFFVLFLLWKWKNIYVNTRSCTIEYL